MPPIRSRTRRRSRIRAGDLDLRHRRRAHQRIRRHGRHQRHGSAVLAVMGVLFIVGGSSYWAKAHGNDALTAIGLIGGNREGKEVRFGMVVRPCSP